MIDMSAQRLEGAEPETLAVDQHIIGSPVLHSAVLDGIRNSRGAMNPANKWRELRAGEVVRLQFEKEVERLAVAAVDEDDRSRRLALSDQYASLDAGMNRVAWSALGAAYLSEIS